MFFITLSNTEINFLEQKLNQRFYIIIRTFLTIKQVELVRKKEFTTTAFDLDNKILIIHIVFLANSNIYLFFKAQVALLIKDEAFIVILFKYADFIDIFSFDLAAKLSEHIKINDYPIN